MLTVFQARNTVVPLRSSFKSSNVIAMLLLVATVAVDRSVLVETVRDYSAYDLTVVVENFRLLCFQTIVKHTWYRVCMSFLSGRSLAGIHTHSKRHPGTIWSHPGIGIHPHICN